MAGSAFAYAWEYVARPERATEFEAAYGPTGDWVRLFGLAPGYIRTELYRDRADPERYVTVDHWASAADWESFRARFAGRFEELDARCAQLTIREREIGRFDAVHPDGGLLPK